ncbi:tetratricopeptide repeat protein, partial [bacterium]|nr:tetratricopeptide repeat protein [bacterium]
ELRRSGLDEIRRRIREEDPPLPSARLSSLGPRTGDLARRLGTTPGRLVGDLRGDLDWIVMRALEKDRTRRYGTPTELADDLRRHLRDEPVLASPPSVLYRTRKFVRRHTIGVAFAAVTAVLLVALAGTMTVQAGRIAAERDRANAESETARQVSEFLVGLFGGVDPTEARGREVTAREILDAGVASVRDDLADQPAVQSTLMRTMGRVYIELSLFDQAEPLIRQAIALAEASGDQLALVDGLDQLAKLLTWTDRNAEAEELARRSLAIRERRLGADAPEVAASLNGLGIALHQQDRLDEAAAAHERALRIRERAFGPDSELAAVSVHNLASVHYFRGDLEAAARLYRRSADIELATGGRENHHYATSLHTLAMVRQEQGRLDEALALQDEALAIRERVLGPDHHHTALSLSTMAVILAGLDRAGPAVEAGRRALAIGEERLGPDHPETDWMRENLAIALEAGGETEEAAGLRARIGTPETASESR